MRFASRPHKTVAYRAAGMRAKPSLDLGIAQVRVALNEGPRVIEESGYFFVSHNLPVSSLRSPLDICFIERFVHGIAQPGWIEACSRGSLDADSHSGSVGFVGQVRDGRKCLEDLFSGCFECQCDPLLPTGGIRARRDRSSTGSHTNSGRALLDAWWRNCACIDGERACGLGRRGFRDYCGHHEEAGIEIDFVIGNGAAENHLVAIYLVSSVGTKSRAASTRIGEDAFRYTASNTFAQDGCGF